MQNNITGTQPSVFITGATGLAGSHLARLLLLKGYDRIRAIRRKTSNMDLLGDDVDRIEWIDGDVLDVQALEDGLHGVDWVFHCAGLISYHPADRDRLHAVNVLGTANIVDVALDAGVKKFLHMSSVSVLARTGRYQVITEGTPWQQTRYSSMYGQSKHLAEREVQRGMAEGLNASVVIPSIILGAGDWDSGSATIFHKIGKGMPVYPQGQNGFVDVRDVALLSVKMLENDGSYRAIANGHTVSYLDLFTQIASRIDAKPPRVKVGPLLSEVAWRALVPMRWITGRQPVINKETSRAAQCFPEYDNSASLEVPDFSYTQFEKTLDDIAREYREAREKNFTARFLQFSEDYLV